MGGPQRRSGRGSEEKNSLLLPEIESGLPARSLITVLTELSWLRMRTNTAFIGLFNNVV